MIISLSSLDRALIPAIPTWFSRSGNGYKMDMGLNRKHVDALISEPIAGLAVLVHTGRGNFLDENEKKQYLKEIVEICHKQGKLVVTGASSPSDAMLAKKNGVDAILIFPNRNQLDGLQDQRRLEKIYAYHEKMMSIHESGILFLLYEETGFGITYTREELSRLLKIKGINGVKFALLSNFELYEDLLSYIARNHQDLSIFSGEDRMFGESLEKIRDLAIVSESVFPSRINALVGMGQVLPYMQAFMLQTFDKPEYQSEYFKVRALISKLARICFCRPRLSNNPCYSLPMEPYISNLGVAAAYQFKLPATSVSDILTVEGERQRRGASQIIEKSLENCELTHSRDEILNVMQDSLEFEQELKEKYGLSLENLGYK